MSTNPKTLTISTNQYSFNLVASGKNTHKALEIKRYWNARLVEEHYAELSESNIDYSKGMPKFKYSEGVSLDIKFLHYDFIKLTVGRNPDRDYLVAKLNGIRITNRDEATDIGVGSYYSLDVGEHIEKRWKNK